MYMGEKLFQATQRIDGVSRTDPAFDIGRQQPAPMHAMDTRAHQRQPLRQGRHARHRLERIARRDKEPHLIQLQLPQRPAGKLDVALMHRVERTAQQADTHMPPVATDRQDITHARQQGSGPDLSGADHLVPIGCQLLQSNGAAGMETPGGNTDFRTKPEFPPVAELGGGIPHDHGAIRPV